MITLLKSLQIIRFGNNKLLLVEVILLLLFTFNAFTQKFPGEKHINVVFRFDDYSAISSTEFELKIIEAFRQNNATLTVGVIPFECAINQLDVAPQENVPLTSVKADILKNAIGNGSIEVALHGYSHQTISTLERTEFSGLNYKDQVNKLSKGKKFLEDLIGVPINIFVPPFNQYDLNTLKALEELKFTTISAFKGGPVAGNSKLNFLPATCGLGSLKDAIESSRISSQSNPLIVVLFHDYDFIEIDEKYGTINYEEFIELLSWSISQEDVHVLSVNQAVKTIADLSSERFIADKWIVRISRFLPLFLQKEEYHSRYMESGELFSIIIRVGFFYLIVILLGIIISFLTGYLFFKRITFFIKHGALLFLMFSFISVVFSFLNLHKVHLGSIACAFFIGSSAGIFIYYLFLRGKGLLVEKAH
jgi:peptidoglycan/xylan/chitin deacetylase (PgdA/CDA1 family)